MMAETAEEISRKPEVRKELQRATGEKRSEGVKARGRDKLWFLVHALVLAGCVAAYVILGWKLIPLPQSALGLLERILRSTALVVIVLTIARAISVYGLGRIEDPSTRFTLQRILHLVVAVVIAVIAVSIIFVNWYAAAAALGVRARCHGVPGLAFDRLDDGRHLDHGHHGHHQHGDRSAG